MPRKSISGIYKIVNTINGRVYVGSASCLGGRRKAHEYRLKAGTHHSIKLQRAWNKYGESAFKFEVIELVSGEEELLRREQHWIDFYKAAEKGYNVAHVAGRTVGIRWTEEQKRKASESKKGVKKSPEHVAAMSAVRVGKRLSEETRRKIGEKAKARFADPAEREKISKANAGRKRTDEERERLSQAQKEAYTDERRLKQAESARSRTHSDEAKAKIAENNRKRVYSSETLLKMSQSAKAVADRKRAEKEAASRNG